MGLNCDCRTLEAQPANQARVPAHPARAAEFENLRRPGRRRWIDVAGMTFPGIVLALMPKCPACLAAYLALGTGVGLSFSTATLVRSILFLACSAALVFFAWRHARWWLQRLR